MSNVVSLRRSWPSHGLIHILRQEDGLEVLHESASGSSFATLARFLGLRLVFGTWRPAPTTASPHSGADTGANRRRTVSSLCSSPPQGRIEIKRSK